MTPKQFDQHVRNAVISDDSAANLARRLGVKVEQVNEAATRMEITFADRPKGQPKQRANANAKARARAVKEIG